MKIVFATSHFGFLRNFEPALRLLAERGHRIHLLADRRDSVGGMTTVETLINEYEQITYGHGPNPKTHRWNTFAKGIRLCLDYWRYLHPRYDGSPKLRERAAAQTPTWAVAWTQRSSFWGRLVQRSLSVLFRLVERSLPYDMAVHEFLKAQAPDVLLITPLLYFGSSQVGYVRAARALGVPTVLCVGSWDHLTTKGVIHDIPDVVTVWNEAQRREASAIHGVSPKKVIVTGAQAYDRWFVGKSSTSREQFCRNIGLDPACPFLLYVCSSPFITPHEVSFVEGWIRAIRSHENPQLRQVGLLIRPHPQNFQQWATVDFSNYKNVAIFPRAGANPVDVDAREQYFDSMFHSAAVVGVNTSALIESAIVGRPVYTVITDEFADTQEGTLHFQHLAKAQGGLLQTAENLDDHTAAVARLLDDQPDELTARRLEFIKTFVRPRGLDVPAASVFTEAIETTGQSGGVPRRTGAFWTPLARLFLYPFAIVATSWERSRKVARRADRKPSQENLRILFAMASPEYLRYYDAVIRELARRGHKVFVAINNVQKKKQARIENLEGISGVRVAGVVPDRVDIWGRVAKGVRGITDFARFLHPRYAAAPALRARMKRKVLPRAFHVLDWIRMLSERRIKQVLRFLAVCERVIPSSPRLESFIQRWQPDLVMVSPLIDAASDQVDLVKSARRLGLPSTACIASWDNLSNKGLVRIQPDAVVVWNEVQKSEAMEFHSVAASRIEVTGAQLFDRWFQRDMQRTREQFAAQVGLPVERPFVLFAGSSGFISESHAEVAFVKRWISALRASSDPSVNSMGILIRPHPYNTVAWEEAELNGLESVSVWPRQRYNAVAESEREMYYDSLSHSAVVVGINTSAMLEAAIVGRPVLSILAPEFSTTQEGTLHFHYLLPEHGGCVRVARDFQEHIRQLAFVLRSPDTVKKETQRFVGTFIRPHGIDRPSTPLMADAIERVGRRGQVVDESVPWWAWLGRVSLLAIAAGAGVISLIGRRPRWWGRMRQSARRMRHRGRKQLSKFVRRLFRGTKQVGRTVGRSGRELGRSKPRTRLARLPRGFMRVLRRSRYRVAMFLRHGTAGDQDVDG